MCPYRPAPGISAVTGWGRRAWQCCGGMVLLLAPWCRVTVHFGRVCIVNSLRKTTEMPGCERSLSRCRSRGTAFPGRLGCQPRPSLPAVASGSGMGGCPPVNHYGALMWMYRPRCVEPPIRTAPVSPKTYRGGNPARGWVRHSASPTRYDAARLAWRCAAMALRPWRSELAVGSASLGSPMCRSRRTNGLPTMAQYVPAVRHS